MFKITFNQNTSMYTFKSKETDRLYIRIQEDYVNDLLRVRGYIYANQIYEALGVEWNPERENLCLRYDGGNKINFHVQSVEDGFEITID